MKIKDTLNLPRTEFPMRARLPEREPEILERWESERLYRRMQERRADAEPYLLHDGPPYANGHLHMGHALNKVLKDIVVRHHFMEGYRTPYVPGWDCHGMPIEHHVTRALGEEARDVDILEIRRRCRDYAREWVDVQNREFRRLGSLGAWDDPYLTMDPAYEAEVLRTFGDLLADGYVVKGLRAIHWCASCRTALAEAELEYAPHRSPSIYVAFPVTDDEAARELLAEALPEDADVTAVELLIWTTTPWTIPANLAIAVHPTLEYSLVRVEGEAPRLLLLATELVDRALRDCGLEPERWSIVARFRGEALEGLRYTHPLFDRNSPVILAEHVTLEQGTGAVHTAPGHGHEDFEIGREYGLDVLCPVDEAGVFDADAGRFEGMFVFDANDPIVEGLDDAGALLATTRVEHSYPHCWRCKNPLIYRATEQWFLDVDHHDLRGRLLEAIRGVRWVPGWGEERIAGMVESRPDWCLSRQRSWGVPIPGIYCLECGDLRMDAGVVDNVVAAVQESGSDVWFERPVEEFLPEGTRCDECGGAEFSRETDIFDVWFESGVSHRAVLATGRWPELG
ncbi:MAG: isoleucine--tRNA ligase, partial [Acidobacteriota bacterium]